MFWSFRPFGKSRARMIAKKMDRSLKKARGKKSTEKVNEMCNRTWREGAHAHNSIQYKTKNSKPCTTAKDDKGKKEEPT